MICCFARGELRGRLLYLPSIQDLTYKANTRKETLSVLIEEAVFARGNSVSFKIDPGVGGNEENA